MLARSGPYAAPSGAYVKPADTDVVQSWPEVGPKKDETQKPWKNHGKTMEKPRDSQGFGTQVEAMLDPLGGHVGPSWGSVGPSWGYVGPS